MTASVAVQYEDKAERPFGTLGSCKIDHAPESLLVAIRMFFFWTPNAIDLSGATAGQVLNSRGSGLF